MTLHRELASKPLISANVLAKWQRIVNLISRLVDVPTCLINKTDRTEIEFLVSSEIAKKDFLNACEKPNNICAFCQDVITNRSVLEVNNALTDPVWRNTKDVKQGIVSYLGFVLLWPDNEVFGSLCVVDNKEHNFSEKHRDLLAEFKVAIESDLATIAQSAELTAGLSNDSKMWRAIQSAAMESILVLNKQGTFISANEIGARRFNRSPDELVGENLYEIIPSDVADSRRKKIQKVIDTKQTLRFEDKRQGRYFDFTIYPVLGEDYEVEKLVVFAADITEHKITRQAMEKSERKYRELVDEAATVILRWDINGNVTFFNEYAQKFFGFSEQEILGKNVVGTIVPETEFTGRDLAKLMEEICRDPAKFEDNENENVKRNGERVWIAWKNRPIFNEQGELYEIHSVGIDITARKRAEDALRESEAKWRTLTEHSPEHILLLDEEGKILFINYTVPELTREQVIGMPMDQFLPDSYKESTNEILRGVWQSGEPAQYTLEYQGEHNINRFFEANVSAVKDGGVVTALVISARDVTERKRVEEALMLSEERQKKAQAVGRVGTWDWNLQTGDLVWSDEMFRIMDYDPDEIIPTYEFFLSCVHSKDREYVDGAVKKALDRIQPYNVDCQIITKKGVEKTANAQGDVKYNEEGEPIEMLGTFQDITERKKIETELEQYRNQLEELVAIRTAELEISNKELESYSYSIAHDLRSPLRAIIGFSQILEDEARDRLVDEDKEILERIVAAGKNMSELIDDILELSRITRTELSYDTVDLSRVAINILNRLEQSQPERDVEWQVADGLCVRGDSRLLGVAIQNLIENAWKYSCNNPRARIHFGKDQSGKEPVFFIKDNGVGFDMEYQNQLFKPFNRLHAVDEFEGTGIGLATVQRIIQRHGGKVWAEGEEHKGATFYFTLRKFSSH